MMQLLGLAPRERSFGEDGKAIAHAVRRELREEKKRPFDVSSLAKDGRALLSAVVYRVLADGPALRAGQVLRKAV